MVHTTAEMNARCDEATLQDFVIQGGAKFGECWRAQSFHAARRLDGRLVLLHKFRPAEWLMAMDPIMSSGEPPDFARPFVSRFTDSFVVAGSAYLVEPLPLCYGLSDVWRYVLQRRPWQALAVMRVLIRQMLAILQQPSRRREDCGLFDLARIVLAPGGVFGVLTDHLECRQGPLRLRKETEGPLQRDFHSLLEVLGTLLDIDDEVAARQGTFPRLSPQFHREIRYLLSGVRESAARSYFTSRTEL